MAWEMNKSENRMQKKMRKRDEEAAAMVGGNYGILYQKCVYIFIHRGKLQDKL